MPGEGGGNYIYTCTYAWNVACEGRGARDEMGGEHGTRTRTRHIL